MSAFSATRLSKSSSIPLGFALIRWLNLPSTSPALDTEPYVARTNSSSCIPFSAKTSIIFSGFTLPSIVMRSMSSMSVLLFPNSSGAIFFRSIKVPTKLSKVSAFSMGAVKAFEGRFITAPVSDCIKSRVFLSPTSLTASLSITRLPFSILVMVTSNLFSNCVSNSSLTELFFATFCFTASRSFCSRIPPAVRAFITTEGSSTQPLIFLMPFPTAFTPGITANKFRVAIENAQPKSAALPFLNA